MLLLAHGLLARPPTPYFNKRA